MAAGLVRRTMCLLVVVFVLGCSVTEDEVRSYSRYSNGRAKLFAVLTAPQYDVKLRTVAAEELIGLKAFTELEDGLKTMPEGDRTGVVEAIVAHLKADLDAPNQQKQIRAKDVLFITYPYLHGGLKTEVEDLLIRWTTEKFGLRFKFGRHDTHKILAMIGRRASPHVLALLRSGKDTQRAADLLKVCGDARAVDDAAASLITSLEENVMEPSEPKIRALGALGGRVATDYLNTLAANNETAGAWDRLKAMDELLKIADKSSVEAARSIVADTEAQFDLRRKALELLGKVGGPDSLPALYQAVRDDDLRMLAWDLALRFGGSEALDHLMKREVKPDWKLDKDGIDQLVSALAKLGPNCEPALVAGLKNRRNLPARMIAIRGLARFGTRNAVEPLQALMDDETPVGDMGSPSATVGVEATTAINKIARR